MVSNLFS